MQKRKQDWQRSISSICSDAESNRFEEKALPWQTGGRGKVKSPALKNRGRGTQIRLGICVRATRPTVRFLRSVLLVRLLARHRRRSPKLAYAKAARLFAESRRVNRAGSRRT